MTSRKVLSFIRKFSFTGLSISSFGALIDYYYLDLGYATTLLRTSLIFGAVWLEQMLVYSFHNSYYFRGLNSLIGLEEESIEGATYDIAETLIKHPEDTTLAFCSSLLGSNALMRSGLSPESIDSYLSSPRKKFRPIL